MNRSILIVICDFLLISLLAFSTVDQNTLSKTTPDRRIKLEMSVNTPENRQDLAGVMKLALDDERHSRDLLVGELSQTRDALGKEQSTVAERNRQIQAKEEQARRLLEDKGSLQQQIASAQTNLQNLRQQYTAASTEALISKEKLAAMEADLRARQEQAATLQQRLGQLEQSNKVVLGEKQQLATQLQVAEVAKRDAVEQAAKMEQEVKVVREEKERLTQHADKLADGVKTLANKSGELVQEIRENRALAPNVVFNEFVTNRVHARFSAHRAGILGLDLKRNRETDAVIVTDGTNNYALCHVDDTAVVLADPATDWESLTGTLGRQTALHSIREMSFYLLDPRVVFVPVTAAEVRELGCRGYRIAADAFKFPEAVVVGAREGYYGECKFQVDLSAPQYLKMDRSFLRGLFGKFNPSAGDLVFSKSGELIGIMANSTYCLRVYNFTAAGTLRFGLDIRDQQPGVMLSRLYYQIIRLPLKLR